MACNHVGGPEMIEMAEGVLRARHLPESAWPGSHFRYTENLTDGPWAAVLVELERRGDEWLVTRIDRFTESVPDADTGFRILRIGSPS
ncbi:MAG TPA: hypothetical protein VMS56_13865 [Thermoanaerobaculia bacterium]|nr:hypothetical protein [Thermoanaerobaculia bacterium]